MVELVGAHLHSVPRVGCSEVREAQVINSLFSPERIGLDGF